MILSERFLKYLRFNTEAVNGVCEIPSSSGQVIFADYLVDELRQIGLDNVEYCNGVVYAYKRSDYSEMHQAIGLVAHLDTYPLNGRGNVEPIVINNYCGEKDLEFTKKKYPTAIIDLLNNDYLHHKLVFSKRNTILGGDDKAGVAEIVTAIENIIEYQIKTMDIYIAFVCDEEIGRGASLINFDKFKADYVFVLDGEFAGEIHISNMSAFFCGIKVNGDYSFLGRAKNVMKNPIDIIAEFMGNFSNNERPQSCDGDEGFFHFSKIQGDALSAILMCTIMTFEEGEMNTKIRKIYDVCKMMNEKYGENTISIVFPKNGYNIYSKNNNEDIVELVERAMIENNLKCRKLNFRGLTDSTIFRENGKNAITIGIGCSSFHSIYEWASITDMEKVVSTIISICMEKVKS